MLHLRLSSCMFVISTVLHKFISEIPQEGQIKRNLLVSSPLMRLLHTRRMGGSLAHILSVPLGGMCVF